MSGYTEEEKVQIAMRHLLPKQIKEHGLSKGMLRMTENTVRKIIREYTRESGVRNLRDKLQPFAVRPRGRLFLTK